MTALPAVLGGDPLLKNVRVPKWPPRYPSTERELRHIYMNEYWSFNGPYEREFCKRFAAYHGAGHCVFMANGTVTLEAALYSLGIGPGDEVLVPAVTWIATAAAAIYVGATPVFVDVQPDTLCMDPEQVEAAVTPQTAAVIPVHLYGSMADLDAIGAVCSKHGLALIEDASHAHGGVWNGKGAGTIGVMGSFSFQESKTLASGEGGAVLTDDPDLASKLYRYKHIGYPPGPRPALKPGERYSPEGFICRNYRATEFQAAILLGQLRTLRRLTNNRARNAAFLREGLETIPGVRCQKPGRLADPQSYYMFVVVFDREVFGSLSIDALQKALAAEGLPCKPVYGSVYRHPLWNVQQKDYQIFSTGKDRFGPCCRVAEEVCSRALALHHSWLLQPQSVLERIVEAVRRIYRHRDALASKV